MAIFSGYLPIRSLKILFLSLIVNIKIHFNLCFILVFVDLIDFLMEFLINSMIFPRDLPAFILSIIASITISGISNKFIFRASKYWNKTLATVSFSISVSLFCWYCSSLSRLSALILPISSRIFSR